MLDFFSKLTDNINDHERIIIMTHGMPDLDGMGASIVFSEILKKMNKEHYIVAPKKMTNKSLNKAMGYLDEKLPFKYEKTINNKNDLLVIFDTHENNLVESLYVLNEIKDKIIIDHHSKGMDVIENCVCEFLDDKKSSTIEIIAEYLKYLNINLDNKFYTLMLAGLCIDTNEFNLKTTERTFEIAAYLLDNGASPEIKQEFLKIDINEYLERYKYMQNISKLNDGVYFCIIDDKKCISSDLAKLADEMMKLEGIKIALALGNNNEETLISARSTGENDVSKMMMKLGGGGHFSSAAARVKGEDIKSVLKKLQNIAKGE